MLVVMTNTIIGTREDVRVMELEEHFSQTASGGKDTYSSNQRGKTLNMLKITNSSLYTKDVDDGADYVFNLT